jgi:hypothetical protein
MAGFVRKVLLVGKPNEQANVARRDRDVIKVCLFLLK